jgi:RHS repeat-associated protein
MHENCDIHEPSTRTKYSYDSSGDVVQDRQNQYAYDAEGRICAVYSGGAYTGYIYNADGIRVAKGTISGLSCNLSTNGFAVTENYILGPNSRQLSEMGANSTIWKHTNVFAGGRLLATYNGSSTYFALGDWLGTKRVETDALGNVQATWVNLPFGDSPSQIGSGVDATEQHFTGKIHDAESGLDYFGARYYASNDARFLTPDPAGLHAIKLANPQTWNLYVYTLNDPLRYTDPTGMYLCADSAKCSSANDKAFAARLHYLSQIEGQYKKGSNGHNTIANILKAYGTAGQRGTADGSTVSVAFTGGKNTGGFTRRLSASTIGVKFASNFSGEAAHFNLPTVGLVGHEGQHVVDGAPTGTARFRSEVNAEAATQDILEGAWMNPALRTTFFTSPNPFYRLRGDVLWNPTWYKPGQLDNAPTAAFLVGTRDYAADLQGNGD